MQKVRNVHCEQVVLYTTADGRLFIGKVINIDKRNNLAYVWYGIDNITAATEIDKLYECDIETVKRYSVENYSLLEMILLNTDYEAEGDTLYSESLHNVIKEFNESNYSYKINELDYLLRLDGTLNTFSKVITALNRLMVAEERTC